MSVDHIVTGGAHHRQGLPVLIVQLGEGGALPAQLLKDHVHQIAGRDGGALPFDLPTQQLLGSRVGPDEIIGGQIIIEAVLGGHIQVNAQIGIDLLVVAQPGFVIAVDDHSHRAFAFPQFVQQSGHAHIGIPQTAQIIVEDVAGGALQHAVAIIGVGPLNIFLHIGAVTLIGHMEAEIGGAVGGFFPIHIQHHRHEDVIKGHRPVGQSGESVLAVAVAVKAQTGVHRLAVIEPLIAGMAALHRIALILEIPDVAVQIALGRQAAHVPHSGEEAPLGVDGAARENIVHQRAAVAFFLNGMVQIVAAPVHPGHVIHRKVGISLPLEDQQVDFPIFGDVTVLILCQNLFGSRRRGRQLLGRHFPLLGQNQIENLLLLGGTQQLVQEGIPEALSDIAFGHRELVDAGILQTAVKKVLAPDGGLQQQQADHRHPKEHPSGLASGEQKQHCRAAQKQQNGTPQGAVGGEIVTGSGRNGHSLPEIFQKIGGQGLVPELEDEVSRRRKAHGHQTAQQIGQPCPPQQGPQQQNQQHRRQQITHQQAGHRKIHGEKTALIGAVGQPQSHQSGSQPKQGQQTAVPQPKAGFFPQRPVLLRKTIKQRGLQELFHRITSEKQNRDRATVRSRGFVKTVFIFSADRGSR